MTDLIFFHFKPQVQHCQYLFKTLSLHVTFQPENTELLTEAEAADQDNIIIKVLYSPFR